MYHIPEGLSRGFPKIFSFFEKNFFTGGTIDFRLPLHYNKISV